MQSHQQQQKKQFSVPSRDQLIQQIKDLDQDIQHIALNLIKCDFNATQKDIEKTFPDIKFIKVKNYNPGSFQVIFEMRIDAINFIRNHYDKKILNRRFFIKMGRQQKQVIENWTGVGNAQRQFRAPNTRPNNTRPQQPRTKKPQQHTEGETHAQQTKPETKQAKEVKTQTKETTKQVKPQTKETTHTQEPVVKKQGKIIPKTDNHYKKPENKKPSVHHDAEKKTDVHVVKKEDSHHAAKKEDTHHVVKKEESHHVAKKPEVQQPAKKEQPHTVAKKAQTQPAKKEQPHTVAKKPEVQPAKKEQPHHVVKKEQPHHAVKKEVPHHYVAKGDKKQAPKEQKKVQAKKDEKKVVQKAPQPEKKQEDDGWIVVGNKGSKKR